MVAGAQDTLRRLAGQVPMAVISGTPDRELAEIVSRRGLADYFTAVHGSPPGKPQIITRLLAERGWHADRVVMVGDGMSDYEAACATGIRFIGRALPQHDPFPPATPLIADLTALAAAIANLGAPHSSRQPAA
jgi:phosphoglycolate phosphatase-like HAD superfamily hydrolase